MTAQLSFSGMKCSSTSNGSYGLTVGKSVKSLIPMAPAAKAGGKKERSATKKPPTRSMSDILGLQVRQT